MLGLLPLKPHARHADNRATPRGHVAADAREVPVTRMTTAALRRSAWAIGLALLAGCAGPGAVIRGTLKLPGDPGAGAAHEDAKTGPLSPTHAVVYLESKPPAAMKAAPRRPEPHLGIGGRGFEPREVTVPRGGAVVVSNRDQRWHQPFSLSASRPFELPSMSPGGRRELTFDRPGAVRVYCRLHDEASALVYVTPGPVWVHPDASGTFALPALPPGEYTLGYWHPRYGERRQHVVLGRRGTALTLRF